MNCIPYGDPQAHGHVGKALIFFRRRGSVVCKHYKKPYNPRTESQQLTREKFKEAVDAWHALDSYYQNYFNWLAEGYPYSGFNLYCGLYIEGELPTTYPLRIETLNDVSITTTRSPAPEGWRYEFFKIDLTPQFGFIEDNRNLWTPDTPPAGIANLYFKVEENTRTINIQDGDTVDITYDGTNTLLIYMPAIIEDTTLYVAEDGSTYYDWLLTDLAKQAP